MNHGLHTLAYKFFENSKSARQQFESSFKKNFNSEDFTTGCFGSYGSVYSNFCSTHTPDTYGNFFFCMGAETNAIESAVQYFNDNFQNITINIVAKQEIGVWGDRWGANNYYGVEYGRELTGNDPNATFNIYMFRFLFNREYSPLARYVLRIPLGFWLRCFSDYHYSKTGRLDNPNLEHTGDYIQEALDWSNSKPGNNGSLISDYAPVSRELFMSFDNIELMNRYFSTPKTDVYYQGLGNGNLNYKSSILPYCVYFVIEHDGATRPNR